MEFVILVGVVVGWLVVRHQDRAEMLRLLELQRQDIGRLERELIALRRSVAPVETPVAKADASVAPVEVVAPVVSVAPVVPPPPPPVVVAAVAPAASVAAARSAYVPMFRSVDSPVGEGAGQSKQSLEHTLGVNWLNRLGIVLLVFGVAFYLAYQLTHFGPVGKVLTAFAVSLVLLGGGLWLERKERYRVFGRAGIGGGWALGFLTTYAMYFFPATQVLTSQAVDLVLLFGVGVGMVLHSLRYRSQVVTGLAFLLAFSTVTISQVTAFSLLASAVLALGLEVVCVREAWYGLELAGVLAAYGNHFLWLDRTLGQYGGPGHVFPHWGESTGLLLLFWAIFRVGYCLRKPVNETAEGMSGLVAIVNSAGVLALMKYQSFHPEWAFRALLALGAVEMALAFVMRGRRKPAFTVLVTIASVLLMAAIPLRFGGATWPVLWVLQGEALFLCGVLLKERVLRWLGVIAHLVVVGQLVLMHAGVVFADREAGVWKIAVAFFCVAAAMWVNAEWLGRRDDEERGDSQAFAAALKVSSFAAAVCAALGIWVLVSGWTLVLLWAMLALVLVEVGLRVRSLVMRVEGYGVLAAALVRLVTVNFAETHERGLHDVRLWAGVGLIAACVLLHERLRLAGEGVLAEERTGVAGAVMWCASALVAGLLYLELPERWLAAGWAGFALLVAVFALVRDGARVRRKALLLAVLAAGRGIFVNLGSAGDWWNSTGTTTAGAGTTNWAADWGRLAFFVAVGLLIAAIPVGFVLRRKEIAAGGGVFGKVLPMPEQVFFFAALAMLVVWIPVDFHQGALTMAWSGLGVAVFLVALAVGERSFRLSGLGLLLFGVAKLLAVDVWGLASVERYLLLIGVGVALLLVSFLYSRFGDRLKEYL